MKSVLPATTVKTRPQRIPTGSHGYCAWGDDDDRRESSRFERTASVATAAASEALWTPMGTSLRSKCYIGSAWNTVMKARLWTAFEDAREAAS